MIQMLFLSVSKQCCLLCPGFSGSGYTPFGTDWLLRILEFGSGAYSLRLFRMKKKRQNKNTICWFFITEKAFLLYKFYYSNVKILLSEQKQPKTETAQEFKKSQHKVQGKREAESVCSLCFHPCSSSWKLALGSYLGPAAPGSWCRDVAVTRGHPYRQMFFSRVLAKGWK